jgi:hypothetical protein
LRSSHHDFNKSIWLPEWSLDADTRGRILSVNPFVPNGIVVFKILHIRQPYLSSQEFRFVGAGLFKQPVDTLKQFLVCSFTSPVGSAVTPQVVTIPLCTTAKLMIGFRCHAGSLGARLRSQRNRRQGSIGL